LTSTDPLQTHSLHAHRGSATRSALRIAIALNAAFFMVESVVAWWTGSLALASDAVHMVSDVGALLLALGAAHIGSLPRSDEQTFGLGRAQVLGAFMNGGLLAAAALGVAWAAVHRLLNPPELLQGGPILVTAILGLVVNLAAAAVLWRADKGGGQGAGDLNVRGAMGHMLADALASVGAILAAGLVLAGVQAADAGVSLLIAILVGWAAVSLLRDAGRVLLQLPPAGLKVADVRATLVGIQGVEAVHELHVWSLDGSFGVLTAHLVVSEGVDRSSVRRAATHALLDQHGLAHTTLQLETLTEAALDGAAHP